MSEAIALFQCVPLSCRLTQSACAARHLEAKGGPTPGVSRPAGTACVACPVGAAHAAGETPEKWPDGSPIVRLGVTPRPSEPAKTKPAPSWLPPRTKRQPRASSSPALEKEERTMPPRRMVTWDGREQSIADWAKEFKMTPEGMRARINAGKNPDGSVGDGAPKKARPSKQRSQPIAAEESAQVAAELDAIIAGPKQLDPAELLRSCGYAVDDGGVAPNGKRVLFLLAGASSPKPPRLAPQPAAYAI